MTSHILDRVETLCSRIVLIRNGAVALDSAVEALIATDATGRRRDLETVVLEALGRSVDERDVLTWLEHEV
jgi:ABC-type Na+ transport system ATPase subunit NatA